MVRSQDFIDEALARGYRAYSGVPCSYLTPLMNCVIADERASYVSAANEGDAVAVAAGTWIGGGRGVAMMQNSGLGNAVSPLTSLTHTFHIPVLVVCSRRGAPGNRDEPQHELMGRITDDLLGSMEIPSWRFPLDHDGLVPVLDEVDRATRGRQTSALIVERGACDESLPSATAARVRAPTPSIREGRGHVVAPGHRPCRRDALDVVVSLTSADRVNDTVVVATTGYTGRELYATADRRNHLYMVGSMGCASSLALGLSLSRPDLNVIVLDGDGAALMRMGNLATVGAHAPTNLVHVVLDNETHDSTGGQATVSAQVDFAGVAAACGYRRVLTTDSVHELETFLQPLRSDGPRFAHVKIRRGSSGDLPRPSSEPPVMLDRLMDHIGSAR